MTSRDLTAYALMAIMLIALVCLIAWRRYHSRERRIQRQRKRDDVRYRDRLARNDADASSRTSGPVS